MVRTPVTTHAPKTSAGELAVRAISASTRKMPDPIMEPATIAVELKRPSVCTSFGVSLAVAESLTGVSSGVCTGLVLLDLRQNVSCNFALEELPPNATVRASAQIRLPDRPLERSPQRPQLYLHQHPIQLARSPA